MSVRRRLFSALPLRRRERPGGGESAAFADLVRGELAAELPDEDLDEDLDLSLDLYVRGSKPRCEEIEYLELVEEARDRIARGGGSW